MLPVVLDLKFLKIYTFGVFLVLAFFWGSYLLWKNVRLTSYKEDDIFDSLFWSMAGGLFFARLVYVVMNYDAFGFDILRFILINGYPGLSLIGGITGGFLTLAFILRTKKIKLSEIIDYVASPFLLALAIGELGSFFSGVEIGTKTKLPLAIKYAGFDGPRHLTALYESILFFVAAFICYKLLFDVRREKLPHGFVFFVAIWIISVVYFLFDKLKEHHLYFLGSSFNEIASLTVLLTFSFYFIYYFRSFIFKWLGSITSLLPSYVSKTYGRLAKKTRKETSAGSGNDQKADN